MIIQNRKINNIIRTVGIFIFMFIYFTPEYVTGFINKSPGLDSMHSFLKIFSFIIVYASGKYIKISVPAIFVILNSVIIFISQYMNGGSVMISVSWLITYLTMYRLVEKYYECNEIILLKGIYYYFLTISFLNFLTLLLFPEGVFDGPHSFSKKANFLLGSYNGFIEYYFTGILAGYLLTRRQCKKMSISWYVLWLISFLSIGFIRVSATSMMGMILLAFSFCFMHTRYIKKILNMGTYTVFILIFFIFIVLLRQNIWIVSVVSDMFAKSSTFSGRATVWDAALKLIKEHFIWGNGMQAIETLRENLAGTSQAHNIILTRFYQTGVIGATIEFSFFFYVMSKTKRIKDMDIKFFFEAITGVSLLMGMFESRSTGIIFLNLCLIFYCSKQYENRINKKNVYQGILQYSIN